MQGGVFWRICLIQAFIDSVALFEFDFRILLSGAQGFASEKGLKNGSVTSS